MPGSSGLPEAWPRPWRPGRDHRLDRAGRCGAAQARGTPAAGPRTDPFRLRAQAQMVVRGFLGRDRRGPHLTRRQGPQLQHRVRGRHLMGGPGTGRHGDAGTERGGAALGLGGARRSPSSGAEARKA